MKPSPSRSPKKLHTIFVKLTSSTVHKAKSSSSSSVGAKKSNSHRRIKSEPADSAAKLEALALKAHHVRTESESAASMLEALQIRKLAEEDEGWENMDIDHVLVMLR